MTKVKTNPLIRVIMLVLAFFLIISSPASVSAIDVGETGEKGYNFYYNSITYEDLQPYVGKVIFEGVDYDNVRVTGYVEHYGAESLALTIEKKSIAGSSHLDYGKISTSYYYDGKVEPISNDFDMTTVTVTTIRESQLFQRAFNKDGLNVGYINVFDRTNAITDLEGSGLNLDDYRPTTAGELKVINFLEYGYTNVESRKGNYGLYFYVYNPQRIEINTTSFTNRVTLACEYKTDENTGELIPVGYDTYNIRYCSSAENGLYYKFRIIDHVGKDGKTIEERVNPETRRYDVSSVVLNEKDYRIGGTFEFSGYGKGYHEDINAESTLKNTLYKELDTITLDVILTTYLTEASSLDGYHRNAITSAFFTVPNQYLTKNGKKVGTLQQVRAEFQEYKTQPMMILEHQEYVDQILPFVGQKLERDCTLDIEKAYFLDISDVNIISGMLGVQEVIEFDGYTFNVPSLNYFKYDNPINPLYYLFKNDGSGTVSARRIEKYIREYNKTADNGFIQVEDGQISADLFIDTVDKGRTRGYNQLDIDAKNTFDILNWGADKRGQNLFLDMILDRINSAGREDVKPIYEITPSDLALVKQVGDKNDYSTFTNNLMISSDEAEAIYSLSKTATTSLENPETPFLLRFAVTDYYSETLGSTHLTTTDLTSFWDCADYLAQATVFFDFRLIHLTFNLDGELRTIPVVNNPIDKFPSAPEPPGLPDIEEDKPSHLEIIKAILYTFTLAVFTIAVTILEIKIVIALFKSDKTWVKIMAGVILALFIAFDYYAITRWAIPFLKELWWWGFKIFDVW